MADTIRTKEALLTLCADNSSHAITAQTLRDFIVSAFAGAVDYSGLSLKDSSNDESIDWDNRVLKTMPEIGGGTTAIDWGQENVIIFAGTAKPTQSNSTGVAGMVAWDADYLYICTATNTWKRIALTW